MAEPYTIETHDLWRVFRLGTVEVPAVRAVNLKIAADEFVALMGPSGSGKSTLMHLLGCLDTPSRGTYRLEGRDVGGLEQAERARIRNERIGFVFQAFNLLPKKSALENVALPLHFLRSRSPGGDQVEARARELIERVGLASRAGHRPTELSGGEQQRVAIARALAAGPAVLLADEPTGNLDTTTGAEIMDLLVELNQSGLTVLVVTHSAAVARYAGRLITMVDGRITSGPEEETAG